MTNTNQGQPNSNLETVYNQFLTFSPHASKSAPARVFFAPGRVNLIGEHTDYNGGYVLPAALDIGTWLFVRERADFQLRIASTSFPQVVEIPINNLSYNPTDDYANYPKGIIREFQKLGFEVPGLELFYYGNLPNSAGLSSSASVEVVTAWMLNDYLGAKLSRERIALLSQAAENQFVGVNCGIMDQFAVAVGQKDSAISLHCDTLDYQLVPIEIEGVSLVIANTNKRRGLTDSKYNERRSECEQALRQIQQKARPDLKNLAEIPGRDWPELESCLENSLIQKRARHVVLENERAKRAVTVLRDGDIEEFGRMMKTSHISLRDDYEVTGNELDTLVEAAWSAEGCIGSRMTGAGFGGCTVSLVDTDKVDAFTQTVKEQYTERIGYEPSFYVTHIGDGVKEVTRGFCR